MPRKNRPPSAGDVNDLRARIRLNGWRCQVLFTVPDESQPTGRRVVRSTLNVAQTRPEAELAAEVAREAIRLLGIPEEEDR